MTTCTLLAHMLVIFLTVVDRFTIGMAKTSIFAHIPSLCCISTRQTYTITRVFFLFVLFQDHE